jgi:GNAT superfamily N-acetyltransferase
VSPAPVSLAERAEVLRLWDACFGPGPGYFERYFGADPWHRPEDCLAIRRDGRLVSAAHVCRRPVEWAGRTLLAGAVANVATLPEHRRQGLSRVILAELIAHMEREGFAFSLLFTGAYGHYEALGWERTPTPRAAVALTAPPRPPEPPLPVIPPGEAAWERPDLYYAAVPRPLLTHRPPPYYRGWVGWNWNEWQADLLGDAERGFAVVQAPPGGEVAHLREWHTLGAAAEGDLLAGAAAWARDRGCTRLEVAALPYHGGHAALAALGEVTPTSEPHLMLRNISLPAADYAEVRRLYSGGDAVWWPSEAF